ncbi:unnamed protein product [Darwinula stevensoni]|uniref:Uncharacterized protein n=1 Tax=Darwinula stevensoni TaxID=69355 RepID=A0A7R8X8H3_9CRUS|nr:unnamed protein product [Darwinula stevensoni]CAG0890137.1 unnamed protein product [Darwinula stevensoni]
MRGAALSDMRLRSHSVLDGAVYGQTMNEQMMLMIFLWFLPNAKASTNQTSSQLEVEDSGLRNGCTVTGSQLQCQGMVQLPANLSLLGITDWVMEGTMETAVTEKLLDPVKITIKKLYIHHAPRLQNISEGTFQLFLPALRFLRITNTAVDQLPKFLLGSSEGILNTINLEYNQIQEIESGTFQVKTDELLLGHNRITSVHANAFEGSSFGTL